MSDTDKTRPYRVKKALGEITKGGSYVRRANKDCGRPSDWQVWANFRERRARRAAKRDLKQGKEPEPTKPWGADWDTY